ncbi:MAG: hypothetical protein QOD55_1098 [Solirubrobacteraceae bacterium]|jgi:hypothetical protein|nr:hypothetical protein [Solirubrobacteraceae bacterium]
MSESSNPSNVRPVPRVPGHAGADLHVCPHCASGLVQPVEAGEPAPGLWDLTLRCPECERWLEVTCDEQAIDRFEAELDRGLAVLQCEMDTFAQLSFREDVERFVAALAADAIMPMDFGAGR